MSLNVRPLFDAVLSLASSSGHFSAVNGSEPKSAPRVVGTELRASVWIDSIRPLARRSGLAATSVRVAVNARVYGSMLASPQDEIDPNIADAVAALMEALTGDFTPTGVDGDIDLLGAHGEGLGAQAGYLSMDGGMYRVMTIVVPFVLNDVWTQVR